MRRSKLKTRVKVCGITRLDDAALALELGARAIGFIFVKESPRFIEFRKANEIMTQLRRMDPLLLGVGVFVNQERSFLDAAILETGINVLQLHGEESPADCASLKRDYPSIKIFKAARPALFNDLEALRSYRGCDALLLDTYVPHLSGGSGILNDFSLATQAHQLEIHERIIFSGGLNPQNILSALQQTQPYAFDVSSGLESSPGVKSEEKMQLFFKEIHDFEGEENDK